MKSKWFRKMLAGALSAALCCGMLTGCGKGVEQTNEELNIYVSESNAGRINYPMRLYQQKYPDVKINVTIISEDAEDFYYDKIQSSLMTGNDVADLLIVDSVFTAHCDIYKIEQSGAFIDLNPLLAQDESYDESLYYTPIIKGLEHDGKQYIYPIAYDLPYIISTEENLAELGISVSEFQSLTVVDFFRLMKQKQEEYGLKADEIASGCLFSETHNIKNIYPCWYCPDVVDYAEGTFSLDTEKMQALLENMDFMEQCTDERWDYTGYMYAAPYKGSNFCRSYVGDVALPSDETPVLSCLRDMNGNINAYVWLAAAIPQLSPNQQNAYNFLRILLSEEVQNFKYDEEGLGYDFTGMATQVLSGADHWWIYYPYSGEGYASVRNADFAYREEVSGSFLYSEWSKLIMEQAEEYYKGNCSAEQAVESVEKKLKIYVSE